MRVCYPFGCYKLTLADEIANNNILFFNRRAHVIDVAGKLKQIKR